MMENSKWQPTTLGKAGRMERCLLDKYEVQVPEIFIEQKDIFKHVMSQETWNKSLTETQRQHLMTFLPKFPDNDNDGKRESLRRLFAGDNFKFGNPLQKFHYQLKDGSYSPEIAKYGSICKKVKQQEYKQRQQKYYSSLVKQILMSRQRVFDQLSQLPPDEPLKFEYVPPPKRKQSSLEHRVKKKYKRLLEEVKSECGLDDTSSEEEEGSPVARSKKQLFKSLNPVPSPEPIVPSVQATFSVKPDYTNGDMDEDVLSHKRPRPISPVEVTEDTYRKMMAKHRHRQLDEDYDDEEHPEYNTQNITLADVMSRCQASRKGGNEVDDDELECPQLPPLKPIKGKKDKRIRKKATAKKMSEMEVDPGGEEEDEDSRTNISTELYTNMEDDTSTVDRFPVQAMQTSSMTDFSKCTSFFSLIRHMILMCTDHRISTVKLEEKVRDWQESPVSDDNPWVVLQDDWVEQVASALKFLAGETIGMNIDNFIPYLDYKERAQQWHWIGKGRDTDEILLKLCEHWLKHKAETAELVVDGSQGSPPPSRSRTGYVVKATSEEEKTRFQRQENSRFEQPHEAFTYEMHGYESVVGPVKGVYSKKNDMNKAREHALLVSNRPAFVTILTLVRDAVARLPNGEGTRGDICELLKDSKFLAPGITDTQINVVASGALDRLHSEKDPCVKYDVNRKVWIYLHRSRTEEEFEKIHQAQAAAMKAKKSLSKPKTPKAVSQKLRDVKTPSQVVTTPTVSSSLKSSSANSASTESLNVEDLSPQTVTQAQLLASPALQSQQGSPRSNTVSGVNTSPRSTVRQVRQSQQGSPRSNTVSGVNTSPRSTVRQQSTGYSSKSAGITQSLTPAQLQLLQQAAAAQAAHVKAQAQAQAVKAQAQAQAQLSKAQNKPGIPGISQSEITSKLQKNITLSQGQLKVIPQMTSMASVVKTTVPPNVTIQTKSDVPVVRQTSILTNKGQGSPTVQMATTVSMVTKTVTMATSTGVTMATTGNTTQGSTNPLVARLVQQMSGGQMVSVSNLLAAQRSLQQGNQPRPTFKIQGGNVVHQIAGGKPIHLTGKPLTHAKGQLVQLGGKGQQQTLGLIQTPQGTINIIPQGTGGATGGLVTLSQTKVAARSPGPSHPANPAITSVSQSKVTAGMLSQLVSQSKSTTVNPGGVVVTQLPAGSITLRPGITSQGKMIPQGQSGLVPAQFVLQQTTAGGKTVNAQSTGNTGLSSILVPSTATGNQSPNLQMVRTVLSQNTAGLKPGQATILISQPTLQTGGVIPPGHIVQTTRGQTRTNQQGKPPMFARIIAPPSNLNVKLGTGVQGVPMIHTLGTGGQTISVQNEAALLQTMNKLMSVPGSSMQTATPTTVVLTTVGSASPIATSQQILAAAGAGKSTKLKEIEKDKK